MLENEIHEIRDTIVAISTPAGRGGIGVVRLSGPAARAIAEPMLRLRHELAPGRARFGELLDLADHRVLDEVVATSFAAPHSYTGEDVVEIAMHGSPVLLEHAVRACCAAGARLAEPGEFTQRAFLAGRLDLTQAEATGDLIESSTMEQARVAARQMGGALARAVAPAIAALPEGPTPVLALVDHSREGGAVARTMTADAWPVVGIPFDRGLRSGGRPSGPARHALLQLAATLLSARKAVTA